MITDIAIWSSGAGHISRVKGLTRFLIKHCSLTILYLGKKPLFSIDHLLPENIDVVFIDSEVDKVKQLVLVNELLCKHVYKVCFIEYISNSFFLKAIPDNVISILDTHDIISTRNESFNSHNYANWDFSISKEREYKIFQLFDYVMFISQLDYNNSLSLLSVNQMILAPHSSILNRHTFRDDVKTIGFVASDYLPNIDAICWFLEKVWSKIPLSLNLTLNIYGLVFRRIPTKLLTENVVIKGYQHDLTKIYSEIDVAVNPVRIGSGLKIKNMEALANGIPLITTSHGASGLEAGIGKSFKVADSDEGFIHSLIELVEDNNLRKALSMQAHAFISDHFEEEQCFGQIKKILMELRATDILDN